MSLIIVLILWGVNTVQNLSTVSGSSGPTTVSIVQSPSYPVTDAALDSLVRDAVAKAGGLESVISPGDFVVIKPNLVETTWVSGSGVITDIRIIRTVVRMAQEAGAGRVVIAEGTAAYRYGEGNDRHCTRKAFRDSGLDVNGDMKDDVTGVELFDLNITGGTDVANPDYVTRVDLQDGLLRTTYYVPNILLECDALISMPIFKNHGHAGITGSLKNRVGCAPNDLYHTPGGIMMKAGLVHYNSPYAERETVARSTVDLNRVRPSDFTVMDALIGITNGPTGTDKPANYVKCVMAGRDAAAVDTIQTLMMAYNPASIRHLVLAESIGFGQTNPALIGVVGKSVQEVRNPFPDGYGDAQRVELTPPVIGGMTPADGSTVSGLVHVALTGVSDNVAVVKSELYVDGVLYATDLAPPYEFSWDTSRFEDGPRVLRAKVYDAALNEAVITRTVIVDSSWTIALNAAGGGLSSTFVFGCRPEALDGVDMYDVPEIPASPYLSVSTCMDSIYYSQDYRSPAVRTDDKREWAVHVRTDVDSGISPVTLNWAGADWSVIPVGLKFQLLDHGTSKESLVAVYDMRDVSSITFPVSGAGVVRYLTLRTVNSQTGKISGYKLAANGVPIHLERKVVTAGNNQFLGNFYVAELDGSTGIRVIQGISQVPVVREGDLVNIIGTLSTVSGERVIISPTVTVVSSGNPMPGARAMANKHMGGESFGPYVQGVFGSTGPSNVGLLVRTWGLVTYCDQATRVFYVDDGSGRQDGSGIPGIKVHCGGRADSVALVLPNEGCYVTVTGMSATASGSLGPVSILRPRKQTDIAVVQSP